MLKYTLVAFACAFAHGFLTGLFTPGDTPIHAARWLSFVSGALTMGLIFGWGDES